MAWKPTIPRGPIAAMYSSPGPCYYLPNLCGEKKHDPRSVHVKAPGYQFGIQCGVYKDPAGPGPKYNVNKPYKVYRDGKDGTPAFSIYSRDNELKPFKTPGPGEYKVERSKVIAWQSPPQYSFGLRHHHRGSDLTPAPNNYTLPGMVGKTIQGGKPQAPAYTFPGRSMRGSFAEDLSKTPGPCRYSPTPPSRYKDRAPIYSMCSRNEPPPDSTKKPGPGAHSPEKVSDAARHRPSAAT